jgi:hypothetical protein
MTESRPPWRTIVIEQLEALASEDDQLAYERNVPIANVPSELLWQWFSVAYHPDDPYFCTCFSSDELSVLHNFNQYFLSRVDNLPQNAYTIRAWLDTATWREIMHEAKQSRERIAA